jgi:hypothetical protein
MSYAIFVQSEGQNEAIAYGDPVATYDDATAELAMMRQDFEVIMSDAYPVEDARALMDIDGKFVAAWRERIAGSDSYDIIAIVEEV